MIKECILVFTFMKAHYLKNQLRFIDQHMNNCFLEKRTKSN